MVKDVLKYDNTWTLQKIKDDLESRGIKDYEFKISPQGIDVSYEMKNKESKIAMIKSKLSKMKELLYTNTEYEVNQCEDKTWKFSIPATGYSQKGFKDKSSAEDAAKTYIDEAKRQFDNIRDRNNQSKENAFMSTEDKDSIKKKFGNDVKIVRVNAPQLSGYVIQRDGKTIATWVAGHLKTKESLKENNDIINRVENLRSDLYGVYLDYTYDNSVDGNYSKIACIVLDTSNNDMYVASLDTNSRIASNSIKYLVEIPCTYDSDDFYDKTDADGNEKDGYLWNSESEEWIEKEEIISLQKEFSFDKMWDNQIYELKYNIDSDDNYEKYSKIKKKSLTEKTGDLLKLVGKKVSDDLTLEDASEIGKKIKAMSGEEQKKYLAMARALGGYYGGQGAGKARLDELRKAIFKAYDSGKESLTEQEGDKIDTITMDVPLITRVWEYFNENTLSDLDLHKILTNTIELSKDHPNLNVNDYEAIINIPDKGLEDNGDVPMPKESLNEKNKSISPDDVDYILVTDREGPTKLANDVPIPKGMDILDRKFKTIDELKKNIHFEPPKSGYYKIFTMVKLKDGQEFNLKLYYGYEVPSLYKQFETALKHTYNVEESLDENEFKVIRNGLAKVLSTFGFIRMSKEIKKTNSQEEVKKYLSPIKFTINNSKLDDEKKSRANELISKLFKRLSESKKESFKEQLNLIFSKSSDKSKVDSFIKDVQNATSIDIIDHENEPYLIKFADSDKELILGLLKRNNLQRGDYQIKQGMPNRINYESFNKLSLLEKVKILKEEFNEDNFRKFYNRNVDTLARDYIAMSGLDKEWKESGDDPMDFVEERYADSFYEYARDEFSKDEAIYYEGYKIVTEGSEDGYIAKVWDKDNQFVYESKSMPLKDVESDAKNWIRSQLEESVEKVKLKVSKTKSIKKSVEAKK